MMSLFRLFSINTREEFKIKKGLEILGFQEKLEFSTQQYILNEIITYILDTSQTTQKSKKIFDYSHDYKYYFYDFLKIGINLNKDEISWWEFDSILEGLFLDEHCSIRTSYTI